MELLYSNENRKIGRDTIIINMGSAADCPSLKLGLCQLEDPYKCYAMKAERMYKAVLPYRRKQARIWKKASAEELAGELIKIIGKRRKVPIKYVRLNEAGDFWGQECIQKASRLADLLKPAGVAVYTYTARRDLSFKGLSGNLTINGSGFRVHNTFQEVTKPTGRVICPGDCRACHICKKRRGVTIEVKKH